MNSPKHLNYETRPFKFVERKMLLSSFTRICYHFGEQYQYIGFGGLSFTDFKLFHKELHIDEMHSIEGGTFSKNKLDINNPYSFIKIHKGNASQVLNDIDLSKKTIAWLDYDGALDNYMFEDLSILFSKLPIGSVYLITCNRELKDPETSDIYQIESFTAKFQNHVPFDLTRKNLATEKSHVLIRTMISAAIEKEIKERNRVGENLKFQQLYNIVYQENRGAKMFTYGGIILGHSDDVKNINIDHLPITSQLEEPYKIIVPNLTFKEMDILNSSLKDQSKTAELIENQVFSETEIGKYEKIYRYLPIFMDIRL